MNHIWNMNNWTKIILVIGFCEATCLSTLAQSQEGIVRTAGTAQKRGEALEGVTLRPVGSNHVVSRSDGSFTMTLNGSLKEGDSFQLASVNKKGYEPLEKDLLQRRFIVSSTVPIEIVLISSKQLARTKGAIEQRARKNAERKYQKQMKELKRKLDNQEISAQKHAEETKKLMKQMETFELLIAAMAEHYARTDYDKLDSLNAAINNCIVKGELEKADSLINTKGDIRQRVTDNIEKGRRIRATEMLLDSASQVIQDRRIGTGH
jgi:hypothetical protein